MIISKAKMLRKGTTSLQLTTAKEISSPGRNICGTESLLNMAGELHYQRQVVSFLRRFFARELDPSVSDCFYKHSPSRARERNRPYRRRRARGFAIFFFCCDLLFTFAGLASAWFASFNVGPTSTRDAVIRASLGRVPSRNTKT